MAYLLMDMTAICRVHTGSQVAWLESNMKTKNLKMPKAGFRILHELSSQSLIKNCYY